VTLNGGFIAHDTLLASHELRAFSRTSISQKKWAKGYLAYSSDNPYRDLRWAFSSIVIEIITELLANSTFTEGCKSGAGAEPLITALIPS